MKLIKLTGFISLLFMAVCCFADNVSGTYELTNVMEMVGAITLK